MLENPEADEVISAYERFGQPVPEALIAPPLHDIEMDLWSAFWELSTDRQVGMSVGPIPWSSINQYSNQQRWLDPDLFVKIIRIMDSEYLTHASGANKTREELRGKR